MKAIKTFLMVTLIYIISAEFEFETKYCEDYAGPTSSTVLNGQPAFSLDFCRATKIKDDETYTRCCFIKWESSENENRKYNCFPAKSSDLKEIDDTIDTIEGFSGVNEVISLDCGSSYLYGSLLLILALLI